MDELLTPELQDFRRRAREIAEKYVRPEAAKLDETEEYPWEIMKRIGEANLHGVWLPKQYGGQGGGIMHLALVVEELSRACGGVGVAYAVNALGSLPILLGGTDEQKNRWLPSIAKGEKFIAFCLSEKEAGSDAGSLQTRAEKQSDGTYVITGDKKWTTNGGAATYYTVFTRTDPTKEGARGLTAFVVEKGMDGFEVGWKEKKMGIRCVPVHETHFRGVKVGVDRLLGGTEGHGFRHAMSTLDRARPGVAAQALGLAQGAFDLAVDYVKKRKQFGTTISSFQGIQFMLADMATRIEAARQLVYASARACDLGAKGMSKLAAMGKVFATDTAMAVTTDCVQLFGGYGYLRDWPIEKYMRDAKITQIYEGTNQIQRVVISRSVIKGE